MKAKEQPQLSEQDKAFALEVQNKYNLSIENICKLVARMRHIINDDWKEFRSTDYVKSCNILCDPEVEITSVNIVTDKGTIEIASTNEMYSYLRIPIQRIKDKFKADLDVIQTALNKGGKYAMCELVMKSIKATALKPRHKELLAFDFIHYYKFFPGKPTMTREEWLANSTEAKNYTEYCRDIGKSRLQNLK